MTIGKVGLAFSIASVATCAPIVLMVVSFLFGFANAFGLPSQPWTSAAATEAVLDRGCLLIVVFCVVSSAATVANSVGILLDRQKKASTVGLILVAGSATAMVIATFFLIVHLSHGGTG